MISIQKALKPIINRIQNSTFWALIISKLNSQGEINNIDEQKRDFYVYILKSHKLNCEMNYCIENACYDMVNELYIESMRK